MFGYIKNMWLKVPLKRKLSAYSAMVILVMVVTAVFTIQLVHYALNSFDVILDDNSRCQEFTQAIEEEAGAFEAFIRERNLKNRESYETASARTKECIRQLPFDYQRIGADRYAQTWNVLNGYEGYTDFRDQLLQTDPEDGEYIPSLYQVYQMQDYLQGYARRLTQMTMTDGDARYQEKADIFSAMPRLILFVSGVMILISLLMTRLLANTVLNPLGKLVRATRKIIANDFGGEDLAVENQDEMGELVHAFNKMKHATQGYINSLMKNYEMSELLHKEEMERVETEKRLEAARLELLKSQINPHFLFNTLNMIACMAKLEDASTTERMITCMGNLFRYDLRTSEQIVPLEQELKVVEDYMYIQKMRFGGRIRYDSDVRVNALQVQIPAFTLQPLVENAIVHGIARKEQGGRILLRAWMSGDVLILSMADTGVGMDETKRETLLEALQGKGTARVGIGLGNIYQRIHSLYQDGDLRVYSRAGYGTVIQMRIPQGKADMESGHSPELSRDPAWADSGKGGDHGTSVDCG